MKTKLLLLSLAFTVLKTEAQTVGLISQSPGNQPGYVLFTPIADTTTYLIDKCGKLVHRWESHYKPGLSVYLLPDGSLLRAGLTGNTVLGAGGTGGIIEHMDWDGNMIWHHRISDSMQCQHHDVCMMPNGNILALVWELRSLEDAANLGRNPLFLSSAMWTEKILELKPIGDSSASIVWEWDAWDHLIQDYNDTASDYGNPLLHPEKINFNYVSGPGISPDWLHINSIDYNPELDQVMVSVHNFCEIWILDHSTSTAEAAGHSGGLRGKGGDLIYRWGNPMTYNAGSIDDRRLFLQHNAQWIRNGLTDSGKILVFNNGVMRPDGNYSSVDIITPPIDATGNYTFGPESTWLPDSASWTYLPDDPSDFFAFNISGAQRMPNGNTLICSGPQGRLFEIDTAKEIVWEYIVPVNTAGPIEQGDTAIGNNAFRCTLYPSEYSAFDAKILIPGQPIELNPLPYDCMPTSIPHALASIGRLSVSNPFRSVIALSSSESVTATMTLTDITGRICAAWPAASLAPGKPAKLLVDQLLPAGIYVLRIATKNSNTAIKLEKE